MNTRRSVSLVGAMAVCTLAACDASRETAEVAEVAPGPQTVAFPGAAGSGEPRLAAGSDGEPVLSWLEPAGDTTVMRYAAFTNGAFGAPREVTRGDDLMVN